MDGIRPDGQSDPGSPESDGDEVFDLGDGVVIRLSRETPAEVNTADPLDGVGDHFYGRLLREARAAARSGGPEARGPLDWIDPYFLAMKAITFNLVRQLFRGKCVTHGRPNREGPCTATAAHAAVWAPVGRARKHHPGRPPFLGVLGQFTLAHTKLVSLEIVQSLPFLPSDPETWTPAQKAAQNALVKAVQPPYDDWEENEFKPAMARPTSLRQHAIARAWRIWWENRVASWWNVDVDGPELVRRFEGTAKRFKHLATAWARALADHEFDALATARDLASACIGEGSTVYLTADGRAEFNVRVALKREANRQKRERKRHSREVSLSTLAGPDGSAGLEPAAAEVEQALDAKEAIQAIVEAKYRELRARIRVLSAGADLMASHKRVARRLAWPLWRGVRIKRVAERAHVNRPNLSTAWTGFKQVLKADPEVRRILEEARDLQ